MNSLLDKIGWRLSTEDLIKYDNANVSFYNYKIGGVMVFLFWIVLTFVSLFISFYPSVIIMTMYYMLICSNVVMGNEEETGWYFASLIFLSFLEVF